MNVQVIYNQGEPEYAVLPWAEYQQLLHETGRDARGQLPEQEAAPTVATPLSRLRSLREQHNMTLEALARDAGISPSYLHMIESGEREPSAVLLRTLGRIFSVQQWDV